MTRYYPRILFLFLFAAACQKKEIIVIPKENVKEALLAYGKENPEDIVVIETDYGSIKIRLYKETPLHRANFIKQIKDDYYSSAEFYRIAYQFVVQGGDPVRSLGYTVPAEINPAFFHKKGAVAMARYMENNPGIESSATEFFIVAGGKYPDWQIDDEARVNGLKLTEEQRQIYLTLGGDMSLDGRFTVFGEVIEGLDVVDKLSEVKAYNEKPVKKVPFKIGLGVE
jgi:cyclophilin family peptidyl-prolyl cis-trans isomerase